MALPLQLYGEIVGTERLTILHDSEAGEFHPVRHLITSPSRLSGTTSNKFGEDTYTPSIPRYPGHSHLIFTKLPGQFNLY